MAVIDVLVLVYWRAVDFSHDKRSAHFLVSARLGSGEVICPCYVVQNISSRFFYEREIELYTTNSTISLTQRTIVLVRRSSGKTLLDPHNLEIFLEVTTPDSGIGVTVIGNGLAIKTQDKQVTSVIREYLCSFGIVFDCMRDTDEATSSNQLHKICMKRARSSNL